MGFIFRAAFWLGLASILVPADARLGYEGQTADGRPPAAIGDQIHDAVYAAWGFASELAQTCETNPSLCEAGQNLASTVAETGSALVIDIHERLTTAAQEHISAVPQAAERHAKFQARAE